MTHIWAQQRFSTIIVPMNEVRAKVKLVNALDDALARHGQLPCDAVRSVQLDALVVKDFIYSLIPAQVAAELGICVRATRLLNSPEGHQKQMDVSEGLVIQCLDRDTVEEAIIFGHDVVIGNTVLNKLELIVDPVTGCLIDKPPCRIRARLV